MGVMQALREGTRGEHERLEALVEESFGLLGVTPDRARYLSLLEAFWGFYHPIERLFLQAQPWPIHGFDYRARQKTPWLERDLQAFSHRRRDPLALPIAIQLPDVASLPRLVGAMYVIEGSMLGGQVISRRLAETMKLDAGSGAAFFHGYGAQTGERWREFSAFAEVAAPTPQQMEVAVDAARQTFLGFGGWLTALDERSPVTV